jgi:hypothetical protein
VDPQETQSPAFKPLPQGPQGQQQPVRQFQRHRILSDAQFGAVTVPEPIRRFTPEGMGEAWQGRAG